MFSSKLEIKKRLFQAAALIFLLVFNAKAQTLVTAPMTTTPAAGEYYNYSSITLSPGFSFASGTGSSLYIHTLSSDCQPFTTMASVHKNYIKTNIPRVAGFDTSLTNYTTCQLMQTIQYLDGLGRPMQTVQVKGSPLGMDLVSPVVYDQFGREAKKYLPYALITGANDGSYKADALTAGSGQAKFYNPANDATLTQQASGVVNTAYPLATTVFEASPLSRVIEQGAPGVTWQPVNHTSSIRYGTNGATDVTLWAVNAAGNGLTGGGSNYAAGSLYATTTNDEDGFASIEYKDKEGRIVCKKAQLNTTTPITYIATYYVYDDLGNLTYVIPPEANGANYPSSIQETDPVFTNYLYGYHYDERNRLIQKKIPGKGWEYMVYNQLDELVMTQDAVQRGTNVWTVTKYDPQGRVILTGLWPSAGQTQSQLQLAIYSGPQWDVRNYADNVTGYTLSSYAAPNKILTINYYDDYTGLPGFPAAFVASGYSTMTKGLPTATKTTVLNSLSNATQDMLYAAHYYDDLGRAAKTYQQHYLGGLLSPFNYDAVTYVYDFTNALTSVTRQHYNNVSGAASLALTVGNTYVYDHMGRKIQTFEKINTSANILLSQTDYNEIGQVKAKHLHGATGAAPFLQDIIYKYNERGWLKRINDPAIAPTATRLFAEQLNYDSVKYSAVPKYNGNITEQDYNAGASLRQHVVYAYDPLNRLTDGNSSAGFSETGITYDNLGNMISLTRGGNTNNYAYNGNQLNTVSNITGSSYGYDVNGNAKHDGRNNATVGYNMLNLPQTVTASTPTAISLPYTYDADGQKLRKVSSGTATDYISGIQYKPDAATIDFIQTEEGRAINSGGNFIYEYTLTDHLGNNRVTFDQTNGKVGEDDYYPFGLNMHGLVNGTNNYLYNKKELQPELVEYDYGARFYDPVIGRFTSIDPMAEVSRRWSTYAYSYNNPVRFVDKDGMIPGDFLDEKGRKVGSDGKEDGKVYVIKTTDKNFDSGAPSAGISKDDKKATEKFIKDNNGNTSAFESNDIAYKNSVEIEGKASARQGMVDVVNQDNGRGGTSDANNREYGGAVKSDGSGTVEQAKPGPVADPIKDPNAHIDLPAYEIRSTFHSHPSGTKFISSGGSNTIGGSTTSGNFLNAPSNVGGDVGNSGSKINYVFSRGNGTVYIYNNTGVIATIPQANFVTPKQ